MLASFAASERFFSQDALINTKLRNRLNKSTFEKIICLKSWGVFNNEEEQAKEEEIATKNEQIEVFEKDNQFFIIPKE